MVRCAQRLLSKMPQYWKRYSDRIINITTRPPRYLRLRGWVGDDRRQHWMHIHKPIWSEEAQMMNVKPHSNLVEKELIEPIKEWTVFVGDRVELLVGRDKGKHGIVKKVIPERNWVFVEGLHVQYKNPNMDGLPLVVEEMPLDVTSEVALVDPVTERPAAKVEWRYTEAGEKVRVILPSEVILQLPESSDLQPDGISPKAYLENPDKDTLEKQLEEPTYKPNLKTFEQDIMDKMGIVETKQRGKTYWY